MAWYHFFTTRPSTAQLIKLAHTVARSHHLEDGARALRAVDEPPAPFLLQADLERILRGDDAGAHGGQEDQRAESSAFDGCRGTTAAPTRSAAA